MHNNRQKHGEWGLVERSRGVKEKNLMLRVQCQSWRNGAKRKKRLGMKRKLLGGAKEMRETDCQEVKKPTDRDHDEGMDDRGLGMAYERGAEKEEKRWENICSVYLLRSRMYDHNPPHSPTGLFCFPPSLSLSLFTPSSLYVFPFLCLCPPPSSSSPPFFCCVTTWWRWHSFRGLCGNSKLYIALGCRFRYVQKTVMTHSFRPKPRFVWIKERFLFMFIDIQSYNRPFTAPWQKKF